MAKQTVWLMLETDGDGDLVHGVFSSVEKASAFVSDLAGESVKFLKYPWQYALDETLYSDFHDPYRYYLTSEVVDPTTDDEY